MSENADMRRMLRAGIAAAALLVSLGALMAAQRAQTPTIEVYKTPTCGCCGLWVEHLERNGFATKVTDLQDLAPLKTQHQVPGRLQSCHTAVVDGYVIEGHVPAADIHRLLKERPAVAGLAVPGMPIGSPGMEVGTTVQPYDVLTFTREGQAGVFASYGRR